MGSNAKGRTVMEVGADGVAVITIINPPVNSLSFDGTLFFKFFYIRSYFLLDFARTHLSLKLDFYVCEIPM